MPNVGKYEHFQIISYFSIFNNFLKFPIFWSENVHANIAQSLAIVMSANINLSYA